MQGLMSILKKMACVFDVKDSIYSMLGQNGRSISNDGSLSAKSFVKADNLNNFKWKNLSYDERQMLQHDIAIHNRLLLARRVVWYLIVTLSVSIVALFTYLSHIGRL